MGERLFLPGCWGGCLPYAEQDGLHDQRPDRVQLGFDLVHHAPVPLLTKDHHRFINMTRRTWRQPTLKLILQVVASLPNRDELVIRQPSRPWVQALRCFVENARCSGELSNKLGDSCWVTVLVENRARINKATGPRVGQTPCPGLFPGLGEEPHPDVGKLDDGGRDGQCAHQDHIDVDALSQLVMVVAAS